MDRRVEVREFLTSRRARLSPERAGLSAYGSNRRVPGLRREEIAMLAGMSVDYYTRLERGSLAGASQSVLESLARALRLDDTERAHLFDLAHEGSAHPSAASLAVEARPAVQQVLDSMATAPACVRNERRDVVATNDLCRALFSELYEDGDQPVNMARFLLLSPRARQFFPVWERVADELVAALRVSAGRYPHDEGLSELLHELRTSSEEFRRRWTACDVSFHHTGTKTIHHPVVGDVQLDYEVMPLPADPGLSLIVYSTKPDTPAHTTLQRLATLTAAAHEPAQPRASTPS